MIDEWLQRIRDIDQLQEQLQTEKENLRNQIISDLKEKQLTNLHVRSGNEAWKVSVSTRVNVKYNEELIASRIPNEEYAALLEADSTRFRKNFETLKDKLLPVLDQVGKISRKKVKESVESGRLDKRVFEGAYQREEKEVLTIRSVQEESGGPAPF